MIYIKWRMIFAVAYIVNAIYKITHKAWKKMQDSNRISTRDLAKPVWSRSNQLSYKATDVRSWSIMYDL